jgi:hypothetical protein
MVAGLNRTACFALVVLMLVSLVACGAGETTSAPVSTSVAIVRQIATVELPPTLSQIDKLATRQALPVTPTSAPPTVAPTETAYVGVFLGQAQSEESLPRIQQPTNQPSPTAEGGACAIAIDPVFGTAWRDNPSVARRVGCALQERFGFLAEVQVFERGVMYQRRDTTETWAIQPGLISAGRYWFAAQPTALLPLPLNIPEGLRPPSETFLPFWSSDPAIPTALGYGRTPQQSADLNLQRVEGGTLLLDVTISQVFLLLDNGDAFGPF